jgi:hypothetical protein
MSPPKAKKNLRNPDLYDEYVATTINKLTRLYHPHHVQHLTKSDVAIDDFISRTKKTKPKTKRRTSGGSPDSASDSSEDWPVPYDSLLQI